MLLVLIGHAKGMLIVWTSPGIELFYHYLFGASGVDLFFAISGFVIARDLYPKLSACATRRSFLDISLAFWTRRIWRIFPTAWLWLAVILLAAAFFNKSGAFRSFDAAWSGTIAAVFQYYNYWFLKCFGHFDCGANFYYWTLSLEEQFYLLLPIAIFLSRRWFPYLLVCLILFQLFFPHRPPIMTVFRTDALLLGVLIALWSTRPSYRAFDARFLGKSALLRVLVIIGLLVAMATDERINAGRLGAFSFSVISLLCAALVLIGSYDKDYLFVPGPFKRFMMWMGSRSCSVYLLHIPAYYGTQEIWYRIVPSGTVYDSSYFIPFVLTGVALVFGMGELSYRFVESPSRRKGTEVSKRFLQRRMAQQQIDPRASASVL